MGENIVNFLSRSCKDLSITLGRVPTIPAPTPSCFVSREWVFKKFGLWFYVSLDLPLNPVSRNQSPDVCLMDARTYLKLITPNRPFA